MVLESEERLKMDDYKNQRQQIRQVERRFRRSHNKSDKNTINNNFGASTDVSIQSKEIPMSSVSALEQKLKEILPSYMMPTNVGDINSVAWPFHHVVNFDLGNNPTYGPATSQLKSFQVSQEAAFIITHLSLKSYGDDTGGEKAPLTIKMIDRQSSRQFTDKGLPIQMLGSKSHPTIFPTPMLIMPNAFMDFEIRSWLLANQVCVGSGKFQLLIGGYKIRLGDMRKVLSTVFG